MRYGFVIDQSRCIGCHACTVACKEEHSVPIGVYRTWVKYIEKGVFPNTRRHFGVLRCNHCDDAPCVEICPTVALFRRPDGIVDFDNERCIGCKSCMQACPYDALYIDPNTNTAAKCNFCAHRIEVGLEPACVIVCPEQAIIAGDLDNPQSKASQIIARQTVTARKPEKGTNPKLFYVGIDGDLLRPTMIRRESSHVWADKPARENVSSFEEENRAWAEKDGAWAPGVAREVYDVSHPPPWGKKIAAYLWTKSVAAGVIVVAALLSLLPNPDAHGLIHVASPFLALVFTGLTVFLLVFDLKRPDRFHYLFIKPNWRSWLVIGGYILIAYSLFALLWAVYGIFAKSPPLWIIWPSAVLALGAAGYSAFLFAQAKGRDLWQSPLFLWHLLVQSLVAGSATAILTSSLLGLSTGLSGLLGAILAGSLIFELGVMLGDIYLPHASEDARRAVQLIKRGPLRARFWGLVIGAGIVLPLLLIALPGDAHLLSVLASALALTGLWVFDDLWVTAGQAVALS